MAEILLTERAIRDLRGISPDVRTRISSKLKEYAEDPIRHARKLSDTVIGSYRFRIGDYRVIFDLDGETVLVLRVGHRKDVYR